MLDKDEDGLVSAEEMASLQGMGMQGAAAAVQVGALRYAITQPRGTWHDNLPSLFLKGVF